MAAYCLAKNVAFDQIIDETYNSRKSQEAGQHWIHFGVKSKNGGQQRKQIFNGFGPMDGGAEGYGHYLSEAQKKQITG